MTYLLLPADRFEWFDVRGGQAQGMRMKINPRVGRELHLGTYSQPVQEILRLHLKPGYIVYDVGAYIGFFSLIASRLVGPEGKVFAFEPNPRIFPILVENVEENRAENVAPLALAAWSEAGRISLELPDQKYPDQGLARTSRAKSESMVVVAAADLNSFAEENIPPDFVKCDVEGAEVDVIRGADQLLARHSPVVVCEYHSEANRDGLARLFREHNYDVTFVPDRNILGHVLAIPKAPRYGNRRLHDAVVTSDTRPS